MRTDIIICVWNQRELTEQCVESIVEHTRHPYRLILMDNASDEPTQQYLRQVEQDSRCEAVVLRNEENLGNTLAVNQGLTYSDAPFVCNLDNDTIVTPGWLEEMVGVATQAPDIGIVVPCYGGRPEQPTVDNIRQWAQDRMAFAGQFVEVGLATGHCCLFKRELIDTIGVWDEEFSPGYFDDAEYSVRAIRAGYRAVSARAACVYHHEHASFKKNTRREEIFSRNRALFEQKCGPMERRLYVVTREHDASWRARLADAIYQQLRYGHWVWLVLAQGVEPLSLEAHGALRIRRWSPFALLWRVLTNVLVKKKKYHRLLVDDERLVQWLRWVQRWHQGAVSLLSEADLTSEPSPPPQRAAHADIGGPTSKERQLQ